MHASLLGILLLAVQTHGHLDSTEVARVLAELKVVDSTVCELAGQALTNYGGFWGGGRDFSSTVMPMPRPMPTPMPMPGGGGGIAGVMRDVTHGNRDHKSGVDAATLGAFRAVLRDDNRCVRNIAARVLGNHNPAGTYELFIGLLRDAKPGLRETGAIGLGELEDSRAIGPLGDALDDAEAAVRARAAWALGEIDEAAAIDPLARALKDRAPEVRRAAVWALGEIENVRAVRPLGEALNDASLDVRLTAAWALGEIEDESAVPLLATRGRWAKSKVPKPLPRWARWCATPPSRYARPPSGRWVRSRRGAA